MSFTVQALVGGADGHASRGVTVGVIERDAGAAPGSRLGLLLGESHEIPRNLQTVTLQEQAALFVDTASRCGACGARFGRPVCDDEFGSANFRSGWRKQKSGR